MQQHLRLLTALAGLWGSSEFNAALEAGDIADYVADLAETPSPPQPADFDVSLDSRIAVAAEKQKCLPPWKHYVALGDSYTAGPSIADEVDSYCQRSDNNYPAILAKAFPGTNFTDASCTSANSTNLFLAQNDKPPQRDAITEDADLVTISLGGNNYRVFMASVAGCTVLSLIAPLNIDSPCQEYLSVSLDARLRAGKDALVADLTKLRQEVPARTNLVLIGYPTIVPVTDTHCLQFPVRMKDLPWVRQVEARLDQNMREAAQEAGVDFISIKTATQGHELCTKDPWLDGAFIYWYGRKLFPYHPMIQGMKHTAEIVYDELAELYGHPQWCN